MNAMIAQVVRGAGYLSPEFQQRLKRWLVSEVQPALEENDRLRVENARLLSDASSSESVVVKRGPGRPRKDESAVSA